ncbi:MAG: hypothetical protein ACRDRZ_06300, partial [Pseudonocardiaceae bacterium]
MVVFDGLDEVLVHLNPHDQQLFTRQLWRAIGDGSGAKMREYLAANLDRDEAWMDGFLDTIKAVHDLPDL